MNDILMLLAQAAFVPGTILMLRQGYRWRIQHTPASASAIYAVALGVVAYVLATEGLVLGAVPTALTSVLWIAIFTQRVWPRRCQRCP
jgi:CHASE2 domain-containing sensor protein